ncbi:hypothetical protein CARUB_v10027958mg, partial [Capsella rubella]
GYVASFKEEVAYVKEYVDSFKEYVDSVKGDLRFIKEEVASIKATVKSTIDLLPTKKDLPAFSTSFKAKADTNTPNIESSSNVSSKESAVVTPELIFRPGTAEPHPLEKTAKVGERVVFKPETGARYDSGTIFVKGYDSSLSEDDIARAMLEHFSPCGMVRRIYFYTDGTSAILRHVFIEMLQGTEAALKLNGSDLGGCKLEVHDAKKREEYYGLRDVNIPYIPVRRNQHVDPRMYASARECPPVYGIVSSSKMNKS